MALAPKKIAEALSSSLQVLEDDLVLPSIPYAREALDEIIVELEISERSPDVEAKLLEYIQYINKQVLEVTKYQAKRYPENFYQEMRTAVLEIRNTATAIYELTKNYHQTLPNTLKELILKWITPLQAELEKRIEMPVADKDELNLKTKHLYAEQSFISRQAPLQQTLMQHLERLKGLLLVSGHPAPRCYISYAWPSEQHKAQEYWVQPFLFVLYDHLKMAGIRMVMDIRDNNPGDSIYQFMKQYHEGNYIILVGTESLLQKHYGKGAHAVQTELSIINNRFEQDQSQFGQSRIYPMLISGTIKSAYPEIYDKYHTVRDARDAGYVGSLKKVIDWIYEASVSQNELEHSSLWQSFYNQNLALSKESSVVEQELSLGYHGQRLEFLRQDMQYQAVQAQEQTQHSQAVQAEQIGVLMKSQGTNPQLFYDANGFKFQRPDANPDFIMRQGLWNTMTGHFAQSDQQILTLTAHGLGGMGKTELAQYYYQHPLRPYTLRAWFYAETKEHLYQQYVDLAAEHPEGMKFSKEMPIEEKVKHIKRWLENQKDCLLIYDNVPDAKEIQALLPTMGTHHILITSRNEVDWPKPQKLDVDMMEEQEAIALICKITGYREDDSDVKQLAKTLGYLPLALAQAGAYIAAKFLSIKDYLSLYEDYQPKLLTDKSVTSPKHEPIWTTFDINFKALGNDCPLALEILKQASWLASSGIPEILLLLMVDSTEDQRLIWNDIKEQIKRYSLMRINIEQKQFKLHPLIQDILLVKQNEVEKIEIFKKTCDYVDSLFEYYRIYNLSLWELVFHAECLHKHAQHIAQIAELQHVEKFLLLPLKPTCLEHIYFYLRLDSEVLSFLKWKEKILENYYGENHLETANTLGNLGNAYLSLKKLSKAESYYEQALKIQESHYGVNDVKTSQALANLGVFYLEIENYLEAKSCFEGALKVQESHYGENNIDTTNTLGNLGNVYLRLEDPINAELYCRRALKIQESDLGKDHLESVTILGTLGHCYQTLKDLPKAKLYYKRTLKIKRCHYGKDHLETVKTLINLGNTYLDLGEPLKAKKCNERALKIQESTDSKDYITMTIILENFGNVYWKLGQLSEAKICFERALKIRGSHYSKDDIKTANLLENIGYVCSKLGPSLDAKSYFERALKIQESHYGKENIEIANLLGNIGNLCWNLEQLLDAKSYYERVLKIQMNYYDRDCPEMLLILKNIGFLLKQMKEHRNAIQYLERARTVYLQNSLVDSDLSKIDVALKEIELALSEVSNQPFKTSSSAKQLSTDVISRLKTLSLKLNKQGVYYFQAKEYMNALRYFKKALKLQQQISNIPNEEIATLHFNIGSIYFFQNDYQSAIAMLQTAYDLRRNLLGDSDAATKKAKTRLEECRKALMNLTLDEIMLETEYSDSVRTRTPPLVFSADVAATQNETQEQPKVKENLSWHYQH